MGRSIKVNGCAYQLICARTNSSSLVPYAHFSASTIRVSRNPARVRPTSLPLVNLIALILVVAILKIVAIFRMFHRGIVDVVFPRVLQHSITINTRRFDRRLVITLIIFRVFDKQSSARGISIVVS